MRWFKFSDSTRKQLPWVILISLTTIVLIAGIFGSLSMLQNSTGENSGNTNVGSNQSGGNSTQREVTSELVIAYLGKEVAVDLFSINLKVTDHMLADDGSLRTTVQLSGKLSGSGIDDTERVVEFTSLNQVHEVGGYNVKLKNATTDSVQLLIAKLVE